MEKALKRRLAPSYPLTLELAVDEGQGFKREFRLCFDFNVCAEIEEKTGVSVLDAKEFLTRWQSAKFLSVVLWASLLPHHSEYASDEGLHVIRSYMDETNLEAISDALFEAYLLYCPEKKRDALRQLVKQGKAESQNPTPPNPQASPSPGPSSTPSPESTSDSAATSSAA